VSEVGILGANSLAEKGDVLYAAGWLGLQTLQIGPANELTPLGQVIMAGFPEDIALYADLAFITANNLGIAVFDVTDPVEPMLLYHHIGPDTPRSIEIVGDILYVVYHNHFAALDIADPYDPKILSVVDMPLFCFDVDVTDELAWIQCNDQLISVDIGDPGQMKLVGELEVGIQPRRVAVAGDVAFVADTKAGLHAIDITDPAQPVLISVFAGEGGGDVKVAGDTAYFSGQDSFFTLDVSDPSNMSILDSLGGAANTLHISGDVAYAGYTVVDISDPSDLKILSFPPPTVFVGASRRIAVANGLAHTAGYTIGGFDTFDVSDLPVITHTGGAPLPGNKAGVGAKGDVAFFAGQNFTSIDVSDPTQPTVLAQVPAGVPFASCGGGRDVQVVGDIAFRSGSNATLCAIDISDPSDMKILGTVDTDGQGYGLTVAGDVAYVILDIGELFAIDISNAADLKILDSLKLDPDAKPHDPNDVAVSDGVAYVTTKKHLSSVDVSDPSDLKLIGDIPFSPSRLAIVDDTLFTANTFSLRAYDVSDPTSLKLVGNAIFAGNALDVVYENGLLYLATREPQITVFDPACVIDP
jgi:hypothetical protein